MKTELQIEYAIGQLREQISRHLEQCSITDRSFQQRLRHAELARECDLQMQKLIWVMRGGN